MTNAQARKTKTREKLVEPVWVKCGSLRCMAYFDREGTWRNFWRHDALPEPVEVLRLDRWR